MNLAAQPDERNLCPCCGYEYIGESVEIPVAREGIKLVCISCYTEDIADGRCPCGAAVEDTDDEDGECAVCHGDPEATGVEPHDFNLYEPRDQEY